MMRRTLTALGLTGRRGVLSALLLAAACATAGGCNQAAFFLYMVQPDENAPKTVEAEIKGLDNHSLAIVVFAENRILYEYPTAREHVTRALAAEFAKKEVRDEIKNLRVADPGSVLGYQDRNLYWNDMDRTKLGKALGADYILFVSLVEFTMREPLSTGVLRGMVSAEVSLHDTSKRESESRVGDKFDVNVLFPDAATPGAMGSDDRVLRQKTVALLVEKIAWKFYKHKEKPVKPS